mmetsp:Transcript_63084/g.149482  ORF Transcript_63084/g.149482 Transcript_63084/m.149482 type:complete len:460 (-) Transcript_63084:320-1699(-)
MTVPGGGGGGGGLVTLWLETFHLSEGRGEPFGELRVSLGDVGDGREHGVSALHVQRGGLNRAMDGGGREARGKVGEGSGLVPTLCEHVLHLLVNARGDAERSHEIAKHLFQLCFLERHINVFRLQQRSIQFVHERVKTAGETAHRACGEDAEHSGKCEGLVGRRQCGVQWRSSTVDAGLTTPQRHGELVVAQSRQVMALPQQEEEHLFVLSLLESDVERRFVEIADNREPCRGVSVENIRHDGGVHLERLSGSSREKLRHVDLQQTLDRRLETHERPRRLPHALVGGEAGDPVELGGGVGRVEDGDGEDAEGKEVVFSHVLFPDARSKTFVETLQCFHQRLACVVEVRSVRPAISSLCRRREDPTQHGKGRLHRLSHRLVARERRCRVGHEREEAEGLSGHRGRNGLKSLVRSSVLLRQHVEPSLAESVGGSSHRHGGHTLLSLVSVASRVQPSALHPG